MSKLWIGKKQNNLLKTGLLQPEYILPGVISTGVDCYFQQVIPDRFKFFRIQRSVHCFTAQASELMLKTRPDNCCMCLM